MRGKPISTRPVFTVGAAAALVGAAMITVVVAPPANAVAPAEAKAAKQDRSRRVCRIITPTSSRLTTRICRTQHEWDEETRAAQDSILKHNFDQTRNGFVGGPASVGNPNR